MIQRVASAIAHGHNYYTQGLHTVDQVRAKYVASPNVAVEVVSNGTQQGQQEASQTQVASITGFKWIDMHDDKVSE